MEESALLLDGELNLAIPLSGKVILAGMKRVYGREIGIELPGDGLCFDRRFRQEPSILVMRRTVVAPAELRPDKDNRSRILFAQQAPSDDDEFTSMDREDVTLDCCVAALECPGWPGIGNEPCTELIAGWMDSAGIAVGGEQEGLPAEIEPLFHLTHQHEPFARRLARSQ